MDTENLLLGQTHLSGTDFLVLGILLAALLAIGYFVGEGQSTTQEFFLAKRKIPWWAACLSFIATEISAVTIISVPATAYTENWQYAQFFIGSTAARLLIAFLFIPVFYQYNCTTIYEYLKHRFGPETQYTASVFFFITRLLASGVRLMVACMAVSILLGWHIIPTIACFTLISAAYISWGGIKSVVWTGVLQASTFILGGLAVIWFLHTQVAGGLPAIFHIAAAAGKLNTINWGPSASDPQFWGKFLKDPNILWLAILNGFFISAAAFGTDQELMQRLLTVATRRESQKTILYTIGGSFLVLIIYLTIGTALFSFYHEHPELALPQKLDQIFPHFIAGSMPSLLRGFMLSAIIMASIDSPLGSLTSSFVTDIYKPLIHKEGSEKHYMWVSRVAVVLFAVALAAIAYWFSFFDKILWLAFKIGGVTFGSLLGIFLLGMLSRRKANLGNIAAMVLPALINLVLLILTEKKIISLGWTWLVIFGTFGTIAIGWLLSSRESPRPTTA